MKYTARFHLSGLRGLFLFLFLFLLSGEGALAASASTAVEIPLDASSWQASWSAGLLMLLLLFTAFYAMTRYEVPLPLAMSLVSCSFLVIQWLSAEEILREGFKHYADLTIFFTAVAIPAHLIERALPRPPTRQSASAPSARDSPVARRDFARDHLCHRRVDAQCHLDPDHDAGDHPALRLLSISAPRVLERGLR